MYLSEKAAGKLNSEHLFGRPFHQPNINITPPYLVTFLKSYKKSLTEYDTEALTQISRYLMP